MKLTIDELFYDMYVESGGSDQCYQNGMWGNCGEKCTIFGSKDECFLNMSEEEIIEYKNNI